MSATRRTTDRRRRVLYTTQNGGFETPSAAERRASERLREARRPTAAYGNGVNRRLEGRWFSLVPNKRRSMGIFTAVVIGVCVSLIVMHYLAFAWQPLARPDRAEIAKPFQLTNPESFGRWATTIMYTMMAGTILLVYQIRRYRNDDFQGHYRLWRIALLVTLFASVNAGVGIIDWCGALIDVAFGKRVALQGGDWLRILLAFAGTIFAIRLIVEVRRSRWAMTAMAIAWASFAIPVAAKWHLLSVQSMPGWMAVTSAPLFACGCFWIATTAYLRVLLREVRGVEDELTSMQRLRAIATSMTPSFHRDRDDDLRNLSVSSSESKPVRPIATTKPEPARPVEQTKRTPSSDSDHADDQEAKPKRGWFGRRKAETAEPSKNNETESTVSPSNSVKAAAMKSASVDVSDSDEGSDDEPVQSRRGWFGRRKKRGENDVNADSPADDNNEAPAKKRSRFSFRLQPSAPVDSSATEDSNDATNESDSTDQEPEPKKSGGLRGWLGRRKSPDADETDDQQDAEPNAVAHSQPDHTSSDSSDGNALNEDEIDWSSMSKSERRRLRKQLKRQGRAA